MHSKLVLQTGKIPECNKNHNTKCIAYNSLLLVYYTMHVQYMYLWYSSHPCVLYKYIMPPGDYVVAEGMVSVFL